ncbi:MAG: transporter substrate-binding domain-containing protein [Candidatus Sumerlaeia bacterium]
MRAFHRNIAAFSIILLAVFCLSCSDDPERGENTDAGKPALPPPEVVEVDDDFQPKEKSDDYAPYIETGDLDDLKNREYLRVLVRYKCNKYLPRDGYMLDFERQLVEQFAHSIGLKPIIICMGDFDKLLPGLLAGQGDIVAANVAVKEDRKEDVAFTVPVGHSREQIVTAACEEKMQKESELAGHTIGVQENTPHVKTLEALKEKYPDIKIETLSDKLTTDEILDKVAGSEIEMVIMDSNILDISLQYRSDVRAVLNVSEIHPLAWALRPENENLKAALDRFLLNQQLVVDKYETFVGDWEDIKKRRVLRVLTRNNAATYFLYRGELMGFEYEMARIFCKKHGLRLEMVVAPTHEDLIPMLMDGKGDMIAASMTISDSRRAQGVEFSRPYNTAYETILSSAKDKLTKPEKLKGRTIYARKSSSYWTTLKSLQKKWKFKLAEVAEDMETEEIIRRVGLGEYDLTIADSHILAIEMKLGTPVRSAIVLGDPIEHGWVVRMQNPKLLAQVNDFWNRYHKGETHNVVYNRYFMDSAKIQKIQAGRTPVEVEGVLSPYDEIVKKYAGEYGFDWRLVVAQMYEESRFDPKAESWVGAKGLLQVMPQTAEEMGFDNLEDPEQSIHAGLMYLHNNYVQFRPNLDVRDRMWFTLAAYNAGIGHVIDARRLSRQMGWSYDRWFGNVEEAMLLLGKREYARRARHGWVRGSEPVNYVRQIKERYELYLQNVAKLEDHQRFAASNDNPNTSDGWQRQVLRQNGLRRYWDIFPVSQTGFDASADPLELPAFMLR